MATRHFDSLLPTDRDTIIDLLGKLLYGAARPVGTAVAELNTRQIDGPMTGVNLIGDGLVVHAATMQCPAANAADVRLTIEGGSGAPFTLAPGQMLNLTPTPGAAVDLDSILVTIPAGCSLQVIYSINYTPLTP